MPTKLQNLIKQGESQSCEFKLAFGEETLETIGAFANAEGGCILIGIKDDGTVIGITIGKKTVEDWAHSIQHVTDPRIQPGIQFI